MRTSLAVVREWVAELAADTPSAARISTLEAEASVGGFAHLLNPRAALTALTAGGGTALAPAPAHTGAVVMALVAGDDTVSGDPDQPLHCTLRYYGDAAELDRESREAILEAAQAAARAAGGPVTVRVAGRANIGNDDPPATALLVEGDTLNDMRGLLASPPSGADSHPHFVPHITLGYGEPIEQVDVPAGTEYVLDRLSVAFGDDVTIIPLGMTAAIGDWDPDMHPRGRDGKFIEKLGLIQLFDMEPQKVGSRTVDFNGRRARVLEVRPDKKNPGNPDIYVGLLDANDKVTVTMTVKPNNVAQAPEKARLNTPDTPEAPSVPDSPSAPDAPTPPVAPLDVTDGPSAANGWLPTAKPGDMVSISELPVGARVDAGAGGYDRRVLSPVLIEGGDPTNPEDYRFRYQDSAGVSDWVMGDTQFRLTGYSGTQTKPLHKMGQKFLTAKRNEEAAGAALDAEDDIAIAEADLPSAPSAPSAPNAPSAPTADELDAEADAILEARGVSSPESLPGPLMDRYFTLTEQAEELRALENPTTPAQIGELAARAVRVDGGDAAAVAQAYRDAGGAGVVRVPDAGLRKFETHVPEGGYTKGDKVVVVEDDGSTNTGIVRSVAGGRIIVETDGPNGAYYEDGIEPEVIIGKRGPASAPSVPKQTPARRIKEAQGLGYEAKPAVVQDLTRGREIPVVRATTSEGGREANLNIYEDGSVEVYVYPDGPRGAKFANLTEADGAVAEAFSAPLSTTNDPASLVMDAGFRLDEQANVDRFMGSDAFSALSEDTDPPAVVSDFERALSGYRETLTGGRFIEMEDAKNELEAAYGDLLDSDWFTDAAEDDDRLEAFMEDFETTMFGGLYGQPLAPPDPPSATPDAPEPPPAAPAPAAPVVTDATAAIRAVSPGGTAKLRGVQVDRLEENLFRVPDRQGEYSEMTLDELESWATTGQFPQVPVTQVKWRGVPTRDDGRILSPKQVGGAGRKFGMTVVYGDGEPWGQWQHDTDNAMYMRGFAPHPNSTMGYIRDDPSGVRTEIFLTPGPEGLVEVTVMARGKGNTVGITSPYNTLTSKDKAIIEDHVRAAVTQVRKSGRQPIVRRVALNRRTMSEAKNPSPPEAAMMSAFELDSMTDEGLQTMLNGLNNQNAWSSLGSGRAYAYLAEGRKRGLNLDGVTSPTAAAMGAADARIEGGSVVSGSPSAPVVRLLDGTNPAKGDLVVSVKDGQTYTVFGDDPSPKYIKVVGPDGKRVARSRNTLKAAPK